MEPTIVNPPWTHDYIHCKRLKCSRDCLVARTGYRMGRVSAREEERLDKGWTSNKGRTLAPVTGNSPSSRHNQSSIDFAIEEIATRGIVFSAEDVTDYARFVGLEVTIEERLRVWCANKALLLVEEGGHRRLLVVVHSRKLVGGPYPTHLKRGARLRACGPAC